MREEAGVGTSGAQVIVLDLDGGEHRLNEALPPPPVRGVGKLDSDRELCGGNRRDGDTLARLGHGILRHRWLSE